MSKLTEKIKERKTLIIVCYGYMALGFFVGLTCGRTIGFLAYIILAVFSMTFYLYATGAHLEKLKATLFPSHPDNSQSKPQIEKIENPTS
jgi:hypothetical protein